MNFKKVIVMLLCASLFVACSDDEEDLQLNSEIEGTWNMTDVSYSGVSTTSGSGITVITTYDGKAYDLDYTVEFTSSPNKIFVDGDYNINLKYTVSSSITGEMSYEQNFSGYSFSNEGAWEIEGDKLIITDSNGEEQEYTILEKSANKFVFTTELNITTGGGGASDLVGQFTLER
ncbi:lipocalin family protein [Fulvivirga ligni]|uniref:lipocalin family protein n=1 Tax=Fulvivirga ligni TaxID=2904246 RepID=UPI001F40F981|nr:lipocalin family protein [Fulvivirga ligni]UII24015.1 lipocalin family protein [Fulvivirga ligni]